MLRARFEKRGNAVWMSHLDLMRLFQRAFQRAGFPLTHTQGFNPRPSVSIALPLSVGVESCCELLDFSLEHQTLPLTQIQEQLNTALVDGIHVVDLYETNTKVKDISFMDSTVSLTYTATAAERAILPLEHLFHASSLLVEKHGKNGTVMQDIVPLMQSFHIYPSQHNRLDCRVRHCCQNPSLNPMQIYRAILTYLPEFTPDAVRYRREEIYDHQNNPFR